MIFGQNPFIFDVVGIHFCEPYRIITRFFKGKSLFELIHNYSDDTKSALLNISSPRESKISLSGCQLTKIAYQIANGMMFLHSNGIVHCDLTSSNVLLDDFGAVKIANFGLSGLVCSFNNKIKNDILSFKRNSYRLIGKPGNPDIVNLFEGGKIAFELNSTSEQVRNDLKLGKKELSEDSYS